jgi:hypothetical protein
MGMEDEMTSTYQIKGQTYNNQDMLKRLGMTWNAVEKAYETTDREAAEKAVNPTYAGRRVATQLKLTIKEI